MKQRAAILRDCRVAIAVLILSPTVVHGATYYVRTNGNNINNGLTNTSGGAWRTIDFAAGRVSAGDTVRVQAGTYVETAAPSVNGTSGNTVTLVADGAVTTCGMSFSGRSYIRVIGFTFDPSVSGCSNNPVVRGTGTNTGLEFWNVVIASNANGKGYSFDTGGGGHRCDKCIFIGGSINNIGGGAEADTAFVLGGNDNLVGYLDFATICYLGLGPSGIRNRYINLNFSGFIQNSGVGVHPDFYYISVASPGFSTNLIESNIGIGTVTSNDNKYFHAQNDSAGAWSDNIWRFNVSYNLGSGFFSMYASSNAITRWRFYNNSIVNCSRANNSSAYDNCGNISNQQGHGNSASIHNNIFYQAWADVATTNLAVWSESYSPTITKNYNLAFSPGGSRTFQSHWTGQANERSNVNPQLTNVASRDFTLQSASGARGVGGPLTTTSGTGSASTSLTVAANTGSFFRGSNASNLTQYSGNLVPGDFITVGSTTVQVSSVSGDTLTLASPISWNSGVPVYFGSSSTIDIGAYPYKSGGYALSANYTISGGTATITPNDASLVRFVVCYSDSVPYAVANSSPYTCAAPPGTFSASVYPRYPSQTLSVTAGASGISAPTGLRIVP